jgi:hypothetical protein
MYLIFLQWVCPARLLNSYDSYVSKTWRTRVVIIITKPSLTWFGRKTKIPKVSRNSTGCKQEHSSDDRVVLQTMKKSLRLFTDKA